MFPDLILVDSMIVSGLLLGVLVFIASVFGLFKRCFLVNLVIVSWISGTSVFFKKISWVLILFSPDCYQSLSGQFHICCSDTSESCVLRMRFSYVFRYLNNLLFH